MGSRNIGTGLNIRISGAGTKEDEQRIRNGAKEQENMNNSGSAIEDHRNSRTGKHEQGQRSNIIQ